MAEAGHLEAVVERCVARCSNDRGELLSVLRGVQGELGCLPRDALTAVAAALGLPRANVEATASFYHLLHGEPHGAYEILFSDNIVDELAGRRELMQYLCEQLWVQPGKLSEDGLVWIATTSDIGLADQAPAALVNGRPLPALDKSRLDLVTELVRERRPLAEWPAMLFAVADNVRRAGPLLGAPFAPGTALARAAALGAEGVLAELAAAKLRGRGGAGFPTATKWSSCRRAPDPQRYVVCNADEGEPGTFKDRVLLARHADLVFEGMTLAALAIGAQQGFVYLRGEYADLLIPLEAALARRRRDGLLGRGIGGAAGFDFDIALRLGAGAYICGEESALIESLEGKPGHPRNRPPYPDRCGFRGKPTAVNNVETFACAARIVADGAAAFSALGTADSAGTKLVSVAGDVARPGTYEVPFGIAIRELLAESGAREPQAVQVGGPSGTLVSWREFGRRIAFEDVPTAGAFMVFGRGRDLFEVARNFTRFFAHESCGFCTPCRVGTTLLANTMDKLAAGKGSAWDMTQMKSLMHVMLTMSHCGLGHTAAQPVVQTMAKFPEAFERRLKNLDFEPAFDLDGALATARLITGRDDRWAHLLSREP